MKKSKNKPLSKEQKEFNRQHSRERIIVEHVIDKMKIFKILAERFRNGLCMQLLYSRKD
ncbi:MAG: hypothetical protein HZA78_07830 [Candidatus Schekmanbacteria bacterium]|nr:hypothetical protein [Candidatus Schekmanbacteria bacterium]